MADLQTLAEALRGCDEAKEQDGGRWLIRWGQQDGRRAHVFEADDIDAVDTAILSGRPLLLLGEPGTGKTQLAEAVARVFSAPFRPWTVDARTEPGDLLYRIDHVERLAHAQVASFFVPGARANPSGQRDERAPSTLDDAALRKSIEDLLDTKRFVRPGPMWWALDFDGARKLPCVARASEFAPTCPREWHKGDRVVALLDEMDKADPDVPNGLLEVLGSGRFRGPKGEICRDPEAQRAPFVFVTSNDERDLPDAFIRRCITHVLNVPADDEAAIRYFVLRGEPHFESLLPTTLESAAKMLLADRKAVTDGAKPGLAEYLDLLRAVSAWTPPKETTRDGDNETQRAWQDHVLERARKFTLQKHARIAESRRGRGR